MLPCAPIHTNYIPTASALNPLPGPPSTTSEPTTPPPGPGITPSAADLDVQAPPQPISLSTSEKKIVLMNTRAEIVQLMAVGVAALNGSVRKQMQECAKLTMMWSAAGRATAILPNNIKGEITQMMATV